MIWSKNEIIAHLDVERTVRMIEQGFIAYSRGTAGVPPSRNFSSRTPMALAVSMWSI